MEQAGRLVWRSEPCLLAETWADRLNQGRQMKRLAALAAGAWLAVLAGCQSTIMQAGTSRNLGPVDPGQAMVAAQGIMSQHFQLDSIDSQAGLITTSPEPTAGREAALLSDPEARSVASMRFKQQGSDMIANCRVEVQRRRSATELAMLASKQNYSGVPSTPARKTPRRRPSRTSRGRRSASTTRWRTRFSTSWWGTWRRSSSAPRLQAPKRTPPNKFGGGTCKSISRATRLRQVTRLTRHLQIYILFRGSRSGRL